MHSTVDVLIRGAGPAGTVAATWLAQAGYSVAIVQPKSTQMLDRIESIGPDITSLLRKICLDQNWLREIAKPVPGLVSRWAGPWEEVQDYVMNAHGPAWSTQRNNFDMALLEYAKSHSQVQLVAKNIPAKLELNATGSNSGEVSGVEDKMVALTRTYKHCSLGDRRLRIEAVPNGWWYALRCQDSLGLGFLTDRQCLTECDPAELWDQECIGPIMDLTNQSSGAGPLRRTPIRCFVTSDHNRIGSARISYDPLTGRGVAESIRNALTTVSNLGQGQRENRGQITRQYASYLKKRQTLYELGAKRFGTGFWLRRLISNS